jgi:hypothetical protein
MLLSVVLSGHTQLLMNGFEYEHAYRHFHRDLRATGTGLTAGNGPGRNTNWPVVDDASLPLP